jgi:hypothetical protein
LRCAHGMPEHDAAATPAPAPAPQAQKRAPAASNLPIFAAIAAALVVGAVAVAIVVKRPSASEATPVTPAASAPAHAAVAARVDRSAHHAPWTGSTKPGWARDGSKTVTFEHVADHDVPVWMKRVRPVLAVRCLYGHTDVFVMPDTAASVESNDHHTVHIRLDDGPDVTESWEDSVDSQELFAPDGVALARALAHAKTMRFAFTPYNASPVVVDFDVEGFDSLVGVVAKTCRWTP